MGYSSIEFAAEIGIGFPKRKAALAIQRAEYEKLMRDLNDKIDDLTEKCRRLQARNTESVASACDSECSCR